MCRVPVTTYILVLIADCLHFHIGKIGGFVDEVITGLEQCLSLEMREQQTLTFKRADDATVPVLGCDFCQLILFLLEGVFSCFCCSCECKDWMRGGRWRPMEGCTWFSYNDSSLI